MRSVYCYDADVFSCVDTLGTVTLRITHQSLRQGRSAAADKLQKEQRPAECYQWCVSNSFRLYYEVLRRKYYLTCVVSSMNRFRPHCGEKRGRAGE